MTPSRFDPSRLSAIFAGGVIGALLRVGLEEALPHGPHGWPWGTFAVNMAGALLLGYFLARLRDHPEDSVAHPFLTTGICGTLTTFSTMQLELFELVDAGRAAIAAAYVAATLAGGYLFVRLGLAVEHSGRPVVPGAAHSPDRGGAR